MYTPGQYPDATLNAIFVDFQNQITANLSSCNQALAGMQTQIKQVTLTLEGELNGVIAQFTALKAFVEANIQSS